MIRIGTTTGEESSPTAHSGTGVLFGCERAAGHYRLANMNSPSELIRSIQWTSDLWTYPDLTIGGDTYPMTWADDDQLYGSSGDPNYDKKYDGFDTVKLVGTPPSVTLEQTNPMHAWTGSAGWGAKPTGMICVDGALYLAIQNVLGWRPPAWRRHSQHGSDATILVSRDKGRSWAPERQDLREPMFPGNRFGGPAFVNHGKDHALARDDFVYAISSDQWDNGTDLRLGRVPRDRIDLTRAWQWASGWRANGEPEWSGYLNDAIPVLSGTGMMSCPDMVWSEGLQRYLLTTWCFNKDFDTQQGTNLVVYESPEPWGPFRVAGCERDWLGRRVGPYCPRIVSKWMDAGGLGGWMLVSGNFMTLPDPAKPFYRPNAIRFRLQLR
jgi:hypothetical protein